MNISIYAAFLAGLISFISPCVLPLLPLYLAFFSTNHTHSRYRFINVFAFSIGFSLIFILFGWAGATLLHSLGVYRSILELLGALLLIFMGLVMCGIIQFQWLLKEKRFHPIFSTMNPLLYFIVGMSFAAGWTPCIGPILASIFLMAAMQESTLSVLSLLSAYSIGLAIPFLLIAIFETALLTQLKRWQKQLFWIYKLSGYFLIAMGVWYLIRRFL